VWNGSAVELFFAYFKKVNINPNGMKTGERHFRDAIKLVYQRINDLKRHSFVIFWKFAVLNQFEYLYFKPL